MSPRTSQTNVLESRYNGYQQGIPLLLIITILYPFLSQGGDLYHALSAFYEDAGVKIYHRWVSHRISSHQISSRLLTILSSVYNCNITLHHQCFFSGRIRTKIRRCSYYESFE
jgi:hypothetical protein